MRRLAWFTAVGMAILTVVFLLWEFRTAIILFILSLTTAAILRPMVEYLVVHNLPRGLALVITYLSVITIFVALGLFFNGPIIAELQAIVTDLPNRYNQIKTDWQTGLWFQRLIAQNFPNLNDLLQAIIGNQWNFLVQNFLSMTIVSLDLFSKIAIVFVLSIYWSVDQDHFKRLWLTLLPTELRARGRDVWENIENEIGSYLRSELIQSLLTMMILAVGYQLIGIKYPVLLAIFGAVCWLVVWFGGLIAVIPAFLAGFVISPAIGLAAAFFTIAILCFLEFIVEPRLYNRQHLSSFLVVIMVLIMVKQFGIIGFLIAPPLAATVQIFVGNLIRPRTIITTNVMPSLDVQLDLIKERLDVVKKMITEKPEIPSPEIVNLVNRLDEMVNKADHGDQLTD